MTNDLQRGFLEFRNYKEHEWFRALVFLLTITGILYLIIHLFAFETAGYKNQKLDNEQQQQINRMYFENRQASDNLPDSNTNAAEPSNAASHTKQEIVHIASTQTKEGEAKRYGLANSDF